ncbi:RusA family crossover junction endodeoxyribonuclease [Cronbergia sp. UHCC 0137]|uniref:RusA family crossover junction endodeoxyribonuclease n=1 Tax=Cronbergia sp. UHCC 0137 TaxID=3110239 RepID=UPI002B1FD37D|nr:RusA family crossover junction endodeoxyribonuclease [Cronbergia sp. UHCC 0137]MEA5620941.1 RusA family crossover junction endodeoxyribonuclease [Cronbergia sp. UHCC 0137]
METFEFIVNGPPVSQQTRRREKLRAWKDTVRQEAEKYWSFEQPPSTESVMLKVTYFYNEIIVDVDNIVKPIQDAMNGLVYLDDTQITDVLVRKRNISGKFIIESITPIMTKGFARGNEFLHIVVTDAPDQEVID